MKLIVILAVAVLALTGCSATPTQTAAKTPHTAAQETATPTPTPTSIAQGIQALKEATAKMSPAQQDAVYLAGARKSVTTGTDANLIAIGRKTCADLAAGMDMTERTNDVVAAGFPSTDAFAIILAAGVVYCKA